MFGLLLCLTFLTVLAASLNLSGIWREIIALGIAVTKASLVILFFMHVRYTTPLMRIVVLAGFVFFSIMVLFTMSDYLSRGWQSTPPRQLVVPVETAGPPVVGPTLPPNPTRAPGQDENVPRGTVNPGQ